MDKIREASRKQFEEWYVASYCTLGDDFVQRSGNYVYKNVRLMWEAWQSARASIVVDTPPLCGDGENDTEYTEGYNDGITATEKTIRSIGLSIKGE